MMSSCLICRSTDTESLLDLGLQPISSRYTNTFASAEVRHPLALHLCRCCGIVQLAQPFPYADLVPPFDWITYREPEGHLDAVTDSLRNLQELTADTRVAGLTFKDATTLERMRARGLTRIWTIDPATDLGAASPNASIESVQALLTPERAAEIVARRGPVDLLIARHILEHAEDPARFLAALEILVAPGGYLVLEVPDCDRNLARQDYTMIWEEHTLYFTAQTLPQVLTMAGCTGIRQEIYPHPFENVIVTIGRKSLRGSGPARHPTANSAAEATGVAQNYGASLADWSARYRQLFTEWTRDGRRLAAYGAGHLTCAFINFHGLADQFAFVVDDTPQKQGLYLPGSNLPVVPREQLDPALISACLFGLGPQSEDKIIAGNTAFAQTGRFHSLLVDSPRSIRHLIDRQNV